MDYSSIFKPPMSQQTKCGRIRLMPGEEVGEHVTEGREETITVLKGTASVYIEDQRMDIPERDVVFVKENVRHNVKNHTDSVLEYIYVVSLLKKQLVS